MSSNKDREEGQRELEIDFDVFEGQLDDEIDRLFAPVDDSPPAVQEAMAFKMEGHTQPDKSNGKNPVESSVAAASTHEQATVSFAELSAGDPEEKAAEPGTSQFHELLDDEVDRLFVPFEGSAPPEEGAGEQSLPGLAEDAHSAHEEATMAYQEISADEPEGPSLEPGTSEFHELLDTEVDRLFVPFEGSAPAQEGFARQDTVGITMDETPAYDQPTATISDFPVGEADQPPLEPGLSQFQEILDKEVDKLFVPHTEASSSADGLPSAATEGEALRVGSTAAPSAPGTSGDLKSDLLLGGASQGEARNKDEIGPLKMEGQSDFEVQLDSEIDKLFVPAQSIPGMVKEDESVQAKGLRGPREPETVPAGPGRDAAMTSPQAKQKPQIGEKGADKRPVTEGEAPKKSKSPVKTVTDQRALTSLVESLSVAYLSLDWEFSLENISRMNEMLKKLDPYSVKKPETKSLSKMVKAVLHFLKTKPESASPQMIEFLRETQDLLKSLLLSQRPASRNEKDKLKNLVSRFRALGGKAVSERRAESRKILSQDQAADKPAAIRPIETPVEPIPAQIVTIRDEDALVGLETWMGSFCTQFLETIRGIEIENKRLFHVEKASRKSDALAPLTTRLSDIRSVLERHLSSFRKQQQELVGQLALIQSLGLSEVKASAPGAEAATSWELPTTAPPEAKDIKHDVRDEGVKEVLGDRQEQVCLFDLVGRRLAVEARYVVKTARVSEKKAMKISSRGYATLKDFKPFLRGLKTGLLGKWRELPEEELKSYQFMPFPTDAFDSAGSGPILPLNGAILLSNGRYHGLIFANFSGIALQTENMVLKPGAQDVIGMIHPESHNPIQVLDVDRIFKELEQ